MAGLWAGAPPKGGKDGRGGRDAAPGFPGGNYPLPPTAPDDFLASRAPSPALPGVVSVACPVGLLPQEIAQARAVIIRGRAAVIAVAHPDLRAAGGVPVALGPASPVRRRGRLLQPPLGFRLHYLVLVERKSSALTYFPIQLLIVPVDMTVDSIIAPLRAGYLARPGRRIPGSTPPSCITNGIYRLAAGELPRAKDAEDLPAAGDGGNGELGGVGADVNPLDLLAAPPLLLLGELKDGGDGLAGNARFAVGQPALLGGDKAAEGAAFPPIDGVIPLVAVFAGGPGFRLGKGVGLVDAAVEGLAPVLGQGFQNGGGTVGVGKGLLVGTVPRDGAGGLDSAIAGAEEQEQGDAGDYVIPSVAEESGMPALDSISRLLDSSATLGMT